MLPAVISRAKPRAMIRSPSVVMNEGTLSTAVMSPLNSPAAMPTPAPANRPSTMLLLRTMVSAATTPIRAMTDPWDRSSSAAMMTRVIPKAAQAKNEVCSRMFWRFPVVRNTSDLTVIIAPRTTTTKNANPASTTRGMATRILSQPMATVGWVTGPPAASAGCDGLRYPRPPG